MREHGDELIAASSYQIIPEIVFTVPYCELYGIGLVKGFEGASPVEGAKCENVILYIVIVPLVIELHELVTGPDDPVVDKARIVELVLRVACGTTPIVGFTVAVVEVVIVKINRVVIVRAGIFLYHGTGKVAIGGFYVFYFESFYPFAFYANACAADVCPGRVTINAILAIAVSVAAIVAFIVNITGYAWHIFAGELCVPGVSKNELCALYLPAIIGNDDGIVGCAIELQGVEVEVDAVVLPGGYPQVVACCDGNAGGVIKIDIDLIAAEKAGAVVGTGDHGVAEGAIGYGKDVERCGHAYYRATGLWWKCAPVYKDPYRISFGNCVVGGFELKVVITGIIGRKHDYH